MFEAKRGGKNIFRASFQELAWGFAANPCRRGEWAESSPPTTANQGLTSGPLLRRPTGRQANLVPGRTKPCVGTGCVTVASVVTTQYTPPQQGGTISSLPPTLRFRPTFPPPQSSRFPQLVRYVPLPLCAPKAAHKVIYLVYLEHENSLPPQGCRPCGYPTPKVSLFPPDRNLRESTR